ncbi:Alkyl hydroperoxide reductase subunit C-like protein [Enhygromyxa salina]|uniref:Thioredoxin peroxidase n=1 Tax=Enhygromyxa salina TaxID=215803 RepID=A0A0C1ZWD5_9BACT|nr:peroxiredoxin [Enhygromyxa salina]KIG15368.1 Alkyl hydroperoxide reductase subunit C-like protein [Enhygromyxa salina]
MSILVGKPAPNFRCSAVLADGSIDEEFELASTTKGKYALVFFYPLDFTFVCPSELVALDHRMPQLRERNVEVIAVSIDSAHTHAAWRNTTLADGGIGEVSYALAGDIKHEIVQAYGVETPDGVALRAAFIIDREGIVRSQIVNDLPLGRNIDELLRLIDALQFHEQHGEVCPAGWRAGDPGMTATAKGVSSYLSEHGQDL